MILLDTNLLGRITDSTDPHCAPARRAIHALLAQKGGLVAAMQSYGITRLLTFNADDFKGLPITLLDPTQF